VEVFFSIYGGFYPPQINLRRFFGPPQLESPQVICKGFEQPLVSELYYGGCFVEGFNLFYCYLLFCGGLKPPLFVITHQHL